MQVNLRSFLTKKSNFLFSIVIASILILFSGYIYYRHESRAIRDKQKNNLKAVAALKAAKISEWYRDEIHDAKIISQNTFLAELLENWRRDPSKYNQTRLLRYISATVHEHGYANIHLITNDGRLLLSANRRKATLDTMFIRNITPSRLKETPVLTDFYRCPVHNEIHLDFVSPVFDNNNSPTAIIVFQINPDTLLYPLIQSRPFPGKSFETLIVRRERDSVLYLNELRFRANSALNLRVPLTDTAFPAVQAALGYQGIRQGLDYRGKKVVADIRPIAGTPWFMIVKIDSDELFAELRTKIISTTLLVLLVVLSIVAWLAFLYSYSRRNVYQKLYQSQAEFHTTLQSIGDAVITTDREGKVTFLNPVAEKLTGWDEGQALGQPLEKVFPIINEDTRQPVENPARRVLREGLIIGLANHTLLINRNGPEIPIADSGAPIKDKNGAVIGVVLVFRDQTAEREAQRALEASEEKYRLIVENANDGIEITQDDRIIFCNPRFAEMLGYSVTEISEISFSRIFTEQAITELKERQILRQKEKPVPHHYETTFRKKDGAIIDVGINYEIIEYRGKPATFAVVRDITERKRNESALKESEQKFRNLFENANDAILLMDKDKFIDCNQKALTMFGVQKDQIIGQSPDFYSPERQPDGQKSREAALEKINAALDGKPQIFEWRHCRHDQTPFDASVSLSTFDSAGKQFILAIVRDITERKQAEEKIIQSEAELRALFSALNDVIIEMDKDGRYLKIAPTNPDLLYKPSDEVLGKTPHEIFSKEYADFFMDKIRETFNTRQVVPIKYSLPIGGRLFWFEGSLSPMTENTVILVVRDITERKRAEAIRTLQYEIADNAFKARDQREFFELLRGSLSRLIDVENFYVAFYDDKTDHFRAVFEKDERDRIPEWPAGKSMTGQVLTQQKSLLLKKADILKLADKGEIELIGSMAEIWLGTPLIIDGKISGVMVVQDYDDPRAYDQTVLEMLEMVAKEMSFYIERKQATEALHALSTRNEAILAAIPDIIMEVDQNKVYTWANPAGLAFFGDDVIGKEAAHYFEGNQNTYNLVQPLFNGREDIIYVESWQRRKDGKKRLLAWWCRNLKDSKGNIIGALSTARDITEWKEAEDQIRYQAELLQNVFDAIIASDNENRIKVWNNAAERIYGWKSSEVIGKKFHEIIRPEYPDENRREVFSRLQSKGLWSGEIIHHRKDGARIPIQSTITTLKNSAGRATGLVSINHDISELKQAENTLLENERFLNAMFKSIQDGISVLNPDLVVRYTNDTMKQWYASNLPLEGKKCHQVYHNSDAPCKICPSLRCMQTGKTEWNIVTGLPGSQVEWIELYSFPIKDPDTGEVTGVVEYVRDITERKRAEAEKEALEIQLRQSQKLESIGTLASGVAHDFNNMLTVILGHAQMALLQADNDNTLNRSLKQIVDSATRAADLTRQLLLFSRKEVMDFKPVNLNQTINNLLKMLRRLIGENIRIKTALSPDLSAVEADEGNIEQVLMNLTVNARDAMPGGGELLIKTENMVITEDLLRTIPHAELGDYVRLSVCDKGVGIPADIQDKIFDPFFSTKETGKGTGLGLSVAYGIIKKHRGWINVYSEVGQGTRFSIYLPATSSAAESKITDKLKPGHTLYGNGEHILLIEDEEGVRELARRTLEQYGYTVFSAASGRQAEEVYQSQNGKFDLIFSDIVLPDANGHELVCRLTAKAPHIPIILSSGYTDEQIRKNIKDDNRIRFVQKPFSIKEMLTTVKQSLKKQNKKE